MDGYSAGNKAAGYIIDVAAGCSAAYNLLLSFSSAESLKRQIIPMVVCCAAVLLLPCFSQRMEKTAACGILLLIFYGLLVQPENNLRASLLLMLQNPAQSFVRFLSSLPSMPAVAGIFAITAFLCGMRRLASALFWAVNMVFPCVLFMMGYHVSTLALAIMTGCSTVMLLRADMMFPACGKPAGAKASLRSTAVAAAAVTGVLICSQFAYSGLHSTFGGRDKIDIPGILAQCRKSVLTTSGFSDYDKDYVLGRKMSVDNTPVLEVKANGPIYLRGRIYCSYTGRSWQAGVNGSRYSDANTAEIGTFSQCYSKAITYYEVNVLGHSSLQAGDLNRADFPVRMCQMKVTTLTEDQKYLFLPERWFYTLSPKLKIRQSYPCVELSAPVTEGTEYSFGYFIPNTKSGAFDLAETDMSQELQNQSNAAKVLYGSNDGITPRVAALAKNITNGIAGEEQKAAAISAWLKKNCTYTLSPPQPWARQDFAEYFLLDSHRGYCQHFATAMVLLLRASGVPARYVEGYAVPSAKASNVENIYEITNAQAHAWVEYYSPKCGFVTADPTPGTSLPKPAALFDTESGAPHVSASSVPARKPSSVPSKPDASPSSSLSASSASHSGGKAENAYGMLFSFLRAAAVAIAIAAAVYFGKVAYRAVWFALLRHGDSRKMVLTLYQYFARVFSKLGFKTPPSGTPNELAAEVRRKIPFSPVSFNRVTEIYCSVRYGGHAVTESERSDFICFYRSLPGTCRRHFGRFRWFEVS